MKCAKHECTALATVTVHFVSPDDSFTLISCAHHAAQFAAWVAVESNAAGEEWGAVSVGLQQGVALILPQD